MNIKYNTEISSLIISRLLYDDASYIVKNISFGSTAKEILKLIRNFITKIVSSSLVNSKTNTYRFTPLHHNHSHHIHHHTHHTSI